ncbi:MAG: hypothetical protein ACI88A_003690 [Paraglaciecola sp.]|jgi:hypothetical protein
MSYSAPHRVKKLSLLRSILAVAGLASVCIHSSFVSAAEEWWFDVEVIVFKRNVSLTEIGEKFPLAAPSAPSAQNLDLLTEYLKPDLSYLLHTLPICNELKETSYLWGPAPVLENQTSDDSLAEDAEIRTVPRVSTAENAHQTVTQLDVDNTSAQDTYDIDVPTATEITQNKAFSPVKIAEILVNWQLPMQVPCAYPEQLVLLKNPFEKPITETMVSRVPVNIDGIDWADINSPYLLPQSLLTLSALFADIGRQRDLLPVLHVGWRQEVMFGEDKAPSFRLFAGNNFADKYSANGELLTNEQGPEYEPSDSNYLAEPEIDTGPADSQIQSFSEESLFARINKALADDSPITIDEQSGNISTDLNVQQKLSALWELDGNLKVYLQYVGRTPYLHVDTNLEYRSPIFLQNKQAKLENDNKSSAIVVAQTNQPNFLQSVQFNQLRRVISKQIHYFDHPLFGMIVHITRYDRPIPELDDPALQENQTELNTKRVKN